MEDPEGPGLITLAWITGRFIVGMEVDGIGPMVQVAISFRSVGPPSSLSMSPYQHLKWKYITGPLVGGEMVRAVGFPWLMRSVGLLNLLYCPLLIFTSHNVGIPVTTLVSNLIQITYTDSEFHRSKHFGTWCQV